MSKRPAPGAEQGTAVNILRRAANASDLFPPLKAVAEIALNVAELVEDFRANKAEWQELGAYVRDVTATVIQSMGQIDPSQEGNRVRLEKLKSALDNTANRIQSEQTQRKGNRFGRFLGDPDMIANMRAQLEETIELFQLGAITTTMVDSTKTLDMVVANGQILSATAADTASIEQRTSLLETDAILDKLQRVPGASWDPSRTCLANTRTPLIDKILEWVASGVLKPSSGAQQSGTDETQGIKILILTAVAGAGKTTIAHTVAQRCAQDRRLISSFFFDHETKDRNTPVALFTTIAADLSGLEKGLARHIATAIEDDRSLLSAPIARQFEELVLRPCQDHTFSRPMVIVIDALDEAWDDGLFDIIQDRAHLLPNTVRLFLTTRMRSELSSLCQKFYAHRIDLDISARMNMKDISVYTMHKLSRLAAARNLGHNWPGAVMRARFLAMADGLFLWVATVCDYLRRRDDPNDELQRLLKRAAVLGSSAETRMDDLYASILGSFDWTDENFVRGYNRVMGAAIATQTPITVSAMKELYRNTPLASDFTLQRLSPLLTGMRELDHDRKPVRVLHQSLRDFLVIRSAHFPEYSRFHVAEKKKSAELASLSLDILNRELKHDIPTVGYLSHRKNNQLGVPKMQTGTISDALWYACRFWPDHVCDTDGPNVVTSALLEFLEKKLVIWLEVVASYGKCRKLDNLRTWMQLHLNEHDSQYAQKYNKMHAIASLTLSRRLQYNERRWEARMVLEHSVESYRQIPINERVGGEIIFALLFVRFSQSLAEIPGERAALEVILEAIEILQQLATNQSASYNRDLMQSFKNICHQLPDEYEAKDGIISMSLSRRRRAPGSAVFVDRNRPQIYIDKHKSVLRTVQTAAEMLQKRADGQLTYTSGLTKSLDSLISNCSSNIDTYREAALTIRNAVVVVQQMTPQLPAGHTPGLATFLNSLSDRLFDINKRKEALLIIQEAVQMHRELTADQPAVYTHDLATSLNSLSDSLSYIGRHQEALLTIQEAVQIHRQPATGRPASYPSDLAQSLFNLSKRLSSLDRHQEALPVIKEAIQLYTPLVADGSWLFIRRLQRAQHVLSNVLIVLGQHKEPRVAGTK